MRTVRAVAILVSACTTPSGPGLVSAPDAKRTDVPREGRIPVGKADLYFREIGRGQPLIVLHGGPDFDHSYLVPDMDRLSDSFRLIYYDQSGRGRSGDRVQPEDVTLETEMRDLDAVRRHLGLGSAALLGHSWGTVLALEYAIKAREIERRLMGETWLSEQYDLLPSLARLSIPTLVIYGDHDFIPARCAASIARAIAQARLATLKDCGHFSYLECPDAVRKEIQAFFWCDGGACSFAVRRRHCAE